MLWHTKRKIDVRSDATSGTCRMPSSSKQELYGAPLSGTYNRLSQPDIKSMMTTTANS